MFVEFNADFDDGSEACPVLENCLFKEEQILENKKMEENLEALFEEEPTEEVSAEGVRFARDRHAKNLREDSQHFEEVLIHPDVCKMSGCDQYSDDVLYGCLWSRQINWNLRKFVPKECGLVVEHAIANKSSTHEYDADKAENNEA